MNLTITFSVVNRQNSCGSVLIDEFFGVRIVLNPQRVASQIDYKTNLTRPVLVRCCELRQLALRKLGRFQRLWCHEDFALYTRAIAEYKWRVPQPVQPAINAATRLCAVLGAPIRHSASPAMHNAAFAALGLDWRYLAFEVSPENLRAAIDGAKVMGFAGLNLTVPHKLLAVEMMDVLDESAKIWGAVNTIKFDSGAGILPANSDHTGKMTVPLKIRAVGFNTDADGLVNSLREDLGLELRGAKVLLLGAGGAGRTAALKLATENVAELFLVNRTSGNAQEIANEIKARFASAKVVVGFPEANVDLILNATSLGLKSEDSSPLDESVFSLKQTRAVYDMIYRPAETKLLAAAKTAGCKTANGLGMLLHQGAKAFEIWTGQPAPLVVMRRALEQNIYGH
jgi:shikimate dehydrogenase